MTSDEGQSVLSELFSLIPDDGLQRFAFDLAWQSTLIGITALLLQRVTRQPAAKAWLAVMACSLCVATPLATAIVRSAGLGILTTQTVLADAHPRPSEANTPVLPVLPETNTETPGIGAKHVEQTPDVGINPGEWHEDEISITPPPVLGAALKREQVAFFSWPAIWSGLCWGWAITAVFLLLRLGRSAFAILRMCQAAHICREPLIVECSRRAASLFGMPEVPPVFVSDRAGCPAVIS